MMLIFLIFWRLTYRWIIDWAEVKLEDPNSNNSTWYYTFDSVWEHNVWLEVADPDDVTWNKVESVEISSILSVDFTAFPRVINKWWYVQFVANSQYARFYEWDFDDGQTSKWDQAKVTHKFDKSWTFSVELTVIDKDWNKNSFTKDIYVSAGTTPFAVIDASYSSNEDIWTQENSCSGQSAFVVNRSKQVKFSWEESIDPDWENTNLDYSWKIIDKYYSKKDVSMWFDELGCFQVKLTVTDQDTWISNSTTKWVKVENQLPEFSSIEITPKDEDTDPVVLDVVLKMQKIQIELYNHIYGIIIQILILNHKDLELRMCLKHLLYYQELQMIIILLLLWQIIMKPKLTQKKLQILDILLL